MASVFAPEVFGPKMWHIIHAASASYPAKASAPEMEEMMFFITGIPAAIPCNACKMDTRRYLAHKFSPEVLKGRQELFEFFVAFHNYVNAKLGKPLMSLETAGKKWLEKS